MGEHSGRSDKGKDEAGVSLVCPRNTEGQGGSGQLGGGKSGEGADLRPGRTWSFSEEPLERLPGTRCESIYIL